MGIGNKSLKTVPFTVGTGCTTCETVLRWTLAIGEEIIGSSSKESAGSQQHENLKGEEEERGGGQTDLLTDQREPSIEEG